MTDSSPSKSPYVVDTNIFMDWQARYYPTAEERKPKREFFIPDVCRELGIPCINLLGLMRREEWEF